MSKHKKTNKKYIIIAAITLLLAGAVGFLLCRNFLNKPAEENTSKEVSESKTESKEEPKVAKTEESGGKTPVKYEGEDPNKAAELSGSINSARVLGDNLVIRVNIDQFLSSGSCDLILTSSDKKYTEKANIEAMVSTSTCDGFSIPVSKLSSGKWNIEIKLSSGDKIGAITGEANI